VNYIRPCPSCGVELRIPLNRGILSVKCPSCGFRFQFDPDDPWVLKTGHIEKNQKFKLSNLFPNRLHIKAIIPVILFSILGLYIIRDCGFIQSLKTSHPSPVNESNVPNTPFIEPEVDSIPNQKNDDSENEKSYESPGTSI
jgi:hypothetical protein